MQILWSNTQNKGDGLISEEASAAATDSTAVTIDNKDKAENNTRVEETLNKKDSSDDVKIVPDLAGELNIIPLISFFFYLKGYAIYFIFFNFPDNFGNWMLPPIKNVPLILSADENLI